MNSKKKRNGNRKKNTKKTFKELKNKITCQLVLTFLKREGKFKVEINTLGYVIGEVLS